MFKDIYDGVIEGLTWFLGQVALFKVAVLGVLLAISDYLISLISDLLPSITPFQDLLNATPQSVLWFMKLMSFDFGLPLVLGAYIARFIIRRIPFIG